MKKLILSAAICMFGVSIASAQENVDVKKETVTKKVVTKGVNTEVRVVDDVNEERETLKVAGTDETNQNTDRVVQKNSLNQVVKDDKMADTQNAAMMEKLKVKQQMDLEASRKAMYDQAEAERKAFAAKQEQLKADMEARRMQLESRPKGMTKLKKD